MSIKVKINLIFLLLGLVVSVGIALFNYHEARQRIFSDALAKAELISSYAMASREYAVKTMRPLAIEIAGPKAFHPELMGGFFVARAVADSFAEKQPGYSFKQATLNPVNKNNLANSWEKGIIQSFSSNPTQQIQKGIMEKRGEKFFYVAKPVIVKKGCLKCHDRQNKAPIGRVQKYPGSGGYGYKVNSVVAAFINYVPIQEALDEVKKFALKTAVIGIILVVATLAIIWLFISSTITKPITRLTTLADEMSRGNNLTREVKSSSSDEIGALYDSFERMRKSVVKMIGMLQKKKARNIER